jgi:hypothetical protein
MAGTFEELGRLQADVAVIIFEGKVVVAARERLADFAGADLAGGAGDDAAEFRRRVVGREDEGVGEEGIAEEHGRMGAVGAVRGVAAVAGVGAVQDVVMDQGSEVNEFDDAGTANQGIRRRAARAGAKREQRTKAFTRVGEHVADHWAHFWFEHEFLRREEFLERREVGFKASVQRGGHAAMCG